MPGQQFSLSARFLSELRNQTFVFRNSRNTLASQAARGHPCLGTEHLPSTQGAAEEKTFPFCLRIQTRKIAQKHILADPFLFRLFSPLVCSLCLVQYLKVLLD